MRSLIHQVHVTHCSAEESVFGESGDTARAASLSPSALKVHFYNAIDPLLIAHPFDLMVDTPPQQLDAIAGVAPVRLVYRRSYNGLQLLGNVRYRKTDKGGQREGCYFAHFVFTKSAARRWNPLDCLRLWDSPLWATPESAPTPQPLKGPFRELADAHCSGQINETVLRSFLTTSANGRFHDPGRTIPRQYRAAAAVDRQQLLTKLIRGFLELDQRRDSLLVVANPSFAALMFFGILRLLPPSAISPHVGFSTYETELTSLPTTLVGTTFYNPKRPSLDPDVVNAAAFFHNTFAATSPRFRNSHDKFPRHIVKALTENGWDETRQVLDRLEAAGARTASELEAVTDVEQRLQQVFIAGKPTTTFALDRLAAVHADSNSKSKKDPEARHFLALVANRLLDRPANDAGVEAASRSANVDLLLQAMFLVAGTQRRSAATEQFKRFIPHLDSSILADWLDRELDGATRGAVLRQYAGREFVLPRASNLAVLFETLLTHLRPAILAKVYVRSRDEAHPDHAQLLNAMLNGGSVGGECVWQVLSATDEVGELCGRVAAEQRFIHAAIRRRVVQSSLSAEQWLDMSLEPRLLTLAAIVAPSRRENWAELASLLRPVLIERRELAETVLQRTAIAADFRIGLLNAYIHHYERPPEFIVDSLEEPASPELDDARRLLVRWVTANRKPEPLDHLLEVLSGDQQANLTIQLLNEFEQRRRQSATVEGIELAVQTYLDSLDAEQRTPWVLGAELPRLLQAYRGDTLVRDLEANLDLLENIEKHHAGQVDLWATIQWIRCFYQAHEFGRESFATQKRTEIWLRIGAALETIWALDRQRSEVSDLEYATEHEANLPRFQYEVAQRLKECLPRADAKDRQRLLLLLLESPPSPGTRLSEPTKLGFLHRAVWEDFCRELKSLTLKPRYVSNDRHADFKLHGQKYGSILPIIRVAFLPENHPLIEPKLTVQRLYGDELLDETRRPINLSPLGVLDFNKLGFNQRDFDSRLTDELLFKLRFESKITDAFTDNAPELRISVGEFLMGKSWKYGMFALEVRDQYGCESTSNNFLRGLLRSDTMMAPVHRVHSTSRGGGESASNRRWK